MTYPSEPGPTLPVLKKISRGRGRPGWFWPASVVCGFYGERWSTDIILTTNHQPTLASFAESSKELSMVVLALEAGGLCPAAAASFGYIDENLLYQNLARLEACFEGRSFTLRVPSCLLPNLKQITHWKPENWTIVVFSQNSYDFKTVIPFEPAAVNPIAQTFGMLLQRMLTGLGLFFGQTLIFALPLAISGWQVLLTGLGLLMTATFLLSIAWPVIPVRGTLKGLVAGLVIAALLTVLFAVNHWLVWPQLVWIVSSAFSFFWMGLILNGTR